MLEILSELQDISKKLCIKVNNGRVLMEYFRIHPEYKYNKIT